MSLGIDHERLLQLENEIKNVKFLSNSIPLDGSVQSLKLLELKVDVCLAVAEMVVLADLSTLKESRKTKNPEDTSPSETYPSLKGYHG